MTDDTAGAVRRTPRPAAKPPVAWWSPTEGFWSTNDGPVEGLRVLDFADEFRAYPPPDAVELVGPDRRRPVVLLRADDCDCGPPYEDCPHGPEPVDALDLVVWLHAERSWQLDEMRLDAQKYRDYLKMANRTTERRGHERDAARAERDRLKFLNGEAEGTIERALAELRERTAERNALRGQVATQEQVLEIVRAQTDDCVAQVDAALGHRYHKPTVHYSIPHVAEKAAAELKQLQARIDAALALIAKGLKWGPFLDPDETRAVLAALQGDQPIEPDERLAGMARPAEGVQLIADAFGIAPAEAAAQLRDAIRAAARSDLDEPCQPTGEADRG